MELEPINDPLAPLSSPTTSAPSGGVYDLPVVGGFARDVRGFYDDMAPTPDDSFGVTAGKEILRHGAVVAAGAAGAAFAMIVVL